MNKRLQGRLYLFHRRKRRQEWYLVWYGTGWGISAWIGRSTATWFGKGGDIPHRRNGVEFWESLSDLYNLFYIFFSHYR